MSANDLKVHVIQHFDAPPDVTFDAWLNPEIASRWLFASETNEILHVQIDPRVGGRFSILERNDGALTDHSGGYMEISRPALLVLSLQVPKTKRAHTSSIPIL